MPYGGELEMRRLDDLYQQAGRSCPERTGKNENSLEVLGFSIDAFKVSRILPKAISMFFFSHRYPWDYHGLVLGTNASETPCVYTTHRSVPPSLPYALVLCLPRHAASWPTVHHSCLPCLFPDLHGATHFVTFPML